MNVKQELIEYIKGMTTEEVEKVLSDPTFIEFMDRVKKG